MEGESILLMLDREGICASSGSACTSGSLDPSHVLMAMKVPFKSAHGTIRFSLSHFNTKEEMDHIVNTMVPAIETLRAMSPFWKDGKVVKDHDNGPGPGIRHPFNDPGAVCLGKGQI